MGVRRRGGPGRGAIPGGALKVEGASKGGFKRRLRTGGLKGVASKAGASKGEALKGGALKGEL